MQLDDQEVFLHIQVLEPNIFLAVFRFCSINHYYIKEPLQILNNIKNPVQNKKVYVLEIILNAIKAKIILKLNQISA